jgi:hypothetical protein
MKHWMDAENYEGVNEKLPEREKWNTRDWALTIGFLILFPPIGIAALLRRLFYRRVWH